MNNPESLGSNLPLQMKQKFGDLLGFARFCFPDGSIIECVTCDVRRDCTVEEIATWMTDGYPICKKCALKTTLINPHVRRMDFD